MKAKDEVQHLLNKISKGDLPGNEPLFTLRAQDVYAAKVVRYWIACCESGEFGAGVPSERLDEACDLARAMDDWPVKQTPGRPDTCIVTPNQ